MFGLGTTELLLILVVLVLLFGANKIPQLAEALGKGIRTFRKASDTSVDVEQKPQQRSLESRDQVQAASGQSTPAAEKKG